MDAFYTVSRISEAINLVHFSCIKDFMLSKIRFVSSLFPFFFFLVGNFESRFCLAGSYRFSVLRVVTGKNSRELCLWTSQPSL